MFEGRGGLSSQGRAVNGSSACRGWLLAKGTPSPSIHLGVVMRGRSTSRCYHFFIGHAKVGSLNKKCQIITTILIPCNYPGTFSLSVKHLIDDTHLRKGRHRSVHGRVEHTTIKMSSHESWTHLLSTTSGSCCGLLKVASYTHTENNLLLMVDFNMQV